MRLFRFAYAASLIAAVSAAFASFASAARELGRAISAFVEEAFPWPQNFELAVALAPAPRVTGLHETRSFRARLAERIDGRHRAPLSSAFAAAA